MIRPLPGDLAAGAAVHVLVAGYVGPGDRVGSTVALVVDGDARVVIDPGMVADRRLILDPLERLGVTPDGVSDVVFSHHHPDHTVNAALFVNARVHDHWAIYRDDVWTSRPADGFRLSPSVVLAATPGHTAEDITTLVGTAEGVVAFTHLWWFAAGPAEDPLATDPGGLHSHRERVLAVAAKIVPGHGPAFVPDETTPR